MGQIALRVSGIIFSLVALIHLFRVLLGIEVAVNGVVIPLWTSLGGFIFAMALAMWMFWESRP